MTDELRQTQDDGARHRPTRYTLTLNDVAKLFEEAGLPRNERSLQRYCAAGRLDCIKEETATGLAYFVDPASVEIAIRQLAQLHGLTDEVRHGSTHAALSHSISHVVAPAVEPRTLSDAPRLTPVERDTFIGDIEAPAERHTTTTTDMLGDDGQRRTQPAHMAPAKLIPADDDQGRPTPTPLQPESRYVAALERENEFLRGQITVKDTQISELTGRARETNHLIGRLQNMLAPLLGTRTFDPSRDTPNDLER